MEFDKMTVNQIMKEAKINKHAATKLKLTRQVPKLRRCEMCLSYSDYTFPISVGLCRKCYEILLSRREKVYTLSLQITFSFCCDMCRRKSIFKYEINPYVCESCGRRFFRHVTEYLKKEKNRR